MNLRRNALLLVVLTALIAVLGDWSGNAALAPLWRVPAGLLLLGLAYESFVARRAQLSLRLDASGGWFLGRPQVVDLRLAHQLGRSLQVEVAPSAPVPFQLDADIRQVEVSPATGSTLKISATPRRLGRFEWPPVRVRVRGVFGLASWSRQLAAPFSVQVLPDLALHRGDAPGLGSQGERTARRLGAGSELLQLRRYQPGDPPRIIDWKASARMRQLVSRDFSEDQHLEVVVVVDAGRSSGLRAGDLDRFGHYVNVAASLAENVVARGDLVGLVVHADRPLLALAPARGIAAVTRLRKALGSAQVTASESSPLEAALRVRTLVRQRALVVMLTDLDDAAAASQLLSAVRILLPKHLPFVAGLSSAAAESMAHATAEDWLDPWRALAAQEYCTGLERKVQALRALGAPALVARPEQLEGAVLEAYGRFRRQRKV